MVFKYDQNGGLADGYTVEIMIDTKGHESKQIFDKLGRLTSVIADGKKTDYAYLLMHYKKL